MTPVANDLCVFAVKRGEMSERFDVYYWQYEFKVLEEKLDNCTFDVVPLEQLIAEKQGVKDGPGGWLINKSEYVDDGIPMLRGVNVLDGRIDLSNTVYITEEKHRQLAASEALPGDILITMRGTFGRAAILPNSIPKANMNAALCRIRLKDAALSEYLMWYLNSDIAYKQFKRHGTKAVQDDLNLGYIKAVRVIVPDLQTQQRSVADLKYKLEAANDKLNKAEMLFSDMSKHVLGKLGLSFDVPNKKIIYATKYADIDSRIDADYYSPEFAHFRMQIEKSAYEVLTVEAISEKIVSGFAAGKEDQADNLPDAQRVPHLRPFSITPDGELTFNTKKYVPMSRLSNKDYCKKNEVIFNNTNSPELVGKTTVFDADIPCAASNHITRITVKEGINPYYVAAFFNVLLSIGYWKLLCTNFNNQAGINTDTLKNVKIPVPPKAIQDEIVAELLSRRSNANLLRKQAHKEWQAAKEQFEKELLK